MNVQFAGVGESSYLRTTASPHTLLTRRPTSGNPTAPWTF